MICSRFSLIRSLFGCFGLLLVAASCMRTTTSLAPPTAITSDTALTIDALLANPARYANTVVGVQGFYSSGIARPACEGWIGAPTGWILSSAPSLQRASVPLFLEIKDSFPSGVEPRLEPTAYQKQVVMHGWLRLYTGPVGCGQSDGQGHYTYDRAAQKQVWYFEAVDLYSEVPIEWQRPGAPTPQPYYQPTPTSAP